MGGKKNSVKCITKVFLILEELAKSDGRMKLTQIAKVLNLPPSTTHRFISSMRELGYVIQDPNSGEYTLGTKLLTLASAVLNKLDLRKIAYPYLEKLRNQTGETANLVVLDSDEALYIEKVDSNALVRVFSLIGKRAPLHATGVGKVLLADMAWSDVLGILKRGGMPALTQNTITDTDLLMKELHKVSRQGFAFDNEECEIGARCVAAPIKNYTGKVIASISVSAPKDRFNNLAANKYVKIIKQEAFSLSQKIGFLEIEQKN